MQAPGHASPGLAHHARVGEVGHDDRKGSVQPAPTIATSALTSPGSGGRAAIGPTPANHSDRFR